MAEQDGRVPGGSGSPTAPRLILGTQLQRFREAAKVSPEEAGYRIRASRSKISRMENGRVGFKERDVADLLTLYGVTEPETRSHVLSLVGLANATSWWSRYDEVLPDWFESYLGLESAASVIRSFELQFVPGLFQAEDYARAVALLGPGAMPGEETDQRVALRLRRQDLLRRPEPPHVWAVLDEGVLRRPLGGREVMRAQIDRLVEVADMPHVTLQVMPFGRGGHAAAGGSFSMLRFEDVGVPDIVYLEHLAGAVYLDKQEDVALYAGVMDRLGAKALTPPQTRRFLAQVRDET
ncbi:MAG: helix-turn-helix domain-containing protein [Nocardiopsaceae bacterium]|nr:helix-turn-helix domain-containing protein [Nocardiopsaceae bacterium]